MLNEYTVGIYKAIHLVTENLAGAIQTVATTGVPKNYPNISSIEEDYILIKEKQVKRTFLFKKPDGFYGICSVTNYSKDNSHCCFIDDKNWNKNEARNIIVNELYAYQKQGWDFKVLADFHARYEILRSGTQSSSFMPFDSSEIISIAHKEESHLVICKSTRLEDMGFDFNLSYFFKKFYTDTKLNNSYLVENKYGEAIICNIKDFDFKFDFKEIYLD